MIAFGGNGPLHATRVARRAQVDQILIPRDPGVGSAVGFLYAPVSFEIIRSRYSTLEGLDVAGLVAFFAQMQAEAEAVVHAGAPGQPLRHRRVAFMRYHGQGHEIEIDLPDRDLNATDIDNLRAAFEAEYSRQFSRTVPGMTIEILNWALSVSTDPPDIPTPPASTTTQQAHADAHTQIRCDVDGSWRIAAVFDRASLRPGDQINGPALIVEPQTTTLVSADFDAYLDGVANIWLTRKEAPKT